MYMYMTDCVYCTVVVGLCVHSHFMCTVQIVKICTFYGLNDYQKEVLLHTGFQQTTPYCAVTCLVLIMQYAHTFVNIFIEGSCYKMLPVHGGFLHLSVFEKLPLCN